MTLNKPIPINGDTHPPFPSARYFQIHFQYLQEIISDLKIQIEHANRQIAELKAQLPCLSEQNSVPENIPDEARNAAPDSQHRHGPDYR